LLEARSSEQECAGANRGDATRPGRTLPDPVDRHRVLGRRLGPLAPGDKQGIKCLTAFGERSCCKRHSGGSYRAFAALSHDFKQVGRRTSRVDDDVVGGDEDLNRPRDIEQLHRWVGEHVDNPDWVWRGARGFWHFRQTMPG
jgi:hypothetical protein